MSNEITKNLVKILNKIPFGRDQTSLNIIQEIPTKAEEKRQRVALSLLLATVVLSLLLITVVFQVVLCLLSITVVFQVVLSLLLITVVFQVDRLDVEGVLAKVVVGGEREGWTSWRHLTDTASSSHQAANTHKDDIMQVMRSSFIPTTSFNFNVNFCYRFTSLAAPQELPRW